MAVGAVTVRFEYTLYSQFERKAVRSAMGKAARLMAREAKRAAASKSGSGAVYTARGRNYQASAPGQPPVRLTGNLWRSIKGRASRRGYAMVVQTLAPHAHLLELGTRKGAARPLLPPVVEEQAGAVLDLLRVAIADGLTVVTGAVGKAPAKVETG